MRLKKIFKRVAFSLGILLFLLLVFLTIAGGGWGEKETGINLLSGPDSVLLFSHRGMANYAPENSRASFDAARSAGLKAIETDVRKTKDGLYFLLHDSEASRLLGIQLPVSEIPSGWLDDMRLYYNWDRTNEKVVLLEDLLETYSGDFTIYLDMKICSFEDADCVAALIQKYNAEKKVLVASSGVMFLSYLEYRHPGINTALEGFDAGKEWTYTLWPKNFRPDYLSGLLRNITPAHLAWLRKKNLVSRRLVYGVEGSQVDAAIASGIRMLIVDIDTTNATMKKYMQTAH